VSAEIPVGPQWYGIRKLIFSWTGTRFPVHTSSAKKLNITDPPIITLTGKAFFDSATPSKINQTEEVTGLGNSLGHGVARQ
jgi:hypothetical protein